MEDKPIPLPGSDAERRAHVAVARRLRDGGRDVAVETHWVRPRWELAHALHAGLGVAASVVAVGAPAVGLGLALFALASLLLDLSGRAFLLRRLTPERATENVIAPDPRGSAAAQARAGSAATAGPGRDASAGAPGDGAPPPFRLLLTAHLDAPRGGLRHRLSRLRTGPPFLWVAFSLLAVAACAAARLAGDGGETAIGIVQLPPTVILLVAVGLLVDSALAGPLPVAGSPACATPAGATAAGALRASATPAGATPAGATPAGATPANATPAGSAVDAVVAVVRALDAAPLPGVAVDVVIAGAGEGQAAGFLAHLRRRRRLLKAARAATVVVELTAADGPPRWWTSDAALLPLGYHPSLLAVAATAADEERTLDAAAARGGRVVGAALRARQRRLPALRLSAPDEASAVALLLAFAELLDAERG
jgi:hypothetical protein